MLGWRLGEEGAIRGSFFVDPLPMLPLLANAIVRFVVTMGSSLFPCEPLRLRVGCGRQYDAVHEVSYAY